MWHLGTQFSGGPGGTGVMVGLHDLRSFFQAKSICDVIFPWVVAMSTRLCACVVQECKAPVGGILNEITANDLGQEILGRKDPDSSTESIFY